MTKRILDIVDMQNDFMDPKGALYVPGAEKIIQPAEQFLAKVKQGDFDLALVKFDTHFDESYAHNPESEQFPPHCIFETWGWNMAVTLPSDLGQKTDVYTMTKNVFNMWAEKPDLEGKNFTLKHVKNAYQKLFNIESDKQEKSPRNQFMDAFNIGKDTEVVMMGVASDYCVHDAMLGYLQRGASVVVLEDLVKGIGTDVPGRSKTGDIHDVVLLDVFKPYLDSGQLKVLTSQQVMQNIRQEKKRESGNTGPKNFHRPT